MAPDKYCTRCGEKYPWYEDECPDCHLTLSAIPPGEQPAPDAELVPVLHTAERSLLPIARVTLEQAGIDYTVEDRGFSEQLFGLRTVASIGETSQPFSVLVRSEDAARATELLTELREGTRVAAAPMPGVSSGQATTPPHGDVLAHAHTGGPPAVDLRDAKTGDYIGSLTEAQFDSLAAELERESSDDDDYYVDGPTLELLARSPVDETVLTMLRQALGTRSGMDVRWSRRNEAMS